MKFALDSCWEKQPKIFHLNRLAPYDGMKDAGDRHDYGEVMK